MRTSELIGPALDWAVAKCESLCLGTDPFGLAPIIAAPVFVRNYSPSTNWAQGGLIIGREKISTNSMGHIYKPSGEREEVWHANMLKRIANITGQTPLIAAMRCFVASKLGDEVDVPEELK